MLRHATSLGADTSSSCDSEPVSHLPGDIPMTAESVAAFMKKVHRIRFSSMSLVKEKTEEQVGSRLGSRSSSCPILEENQELDEDEVTVVTPTLPSGRRMSHLGHSSGLPGLLSSDFTASVAMATSTMTTAMSTFVSSIKPTKNASSQTSFYVPTSSGTECVPFAGAEDEEKCGIVQGHFPYEELFLMSLPFGPFVRCYSCMMEQAKQKPKCDPGEKKHYTESTIGKHHCGVFPSAF